MWARGGGVVQRLPLQNPSGLSKCDTGDESIRGSENSCCWRGLKELDAEGPAITNMNGLFEQAVVVQVIGIFGVKSFITD